ncbi:TetR/AcrR family transcriptional regulator [Thermodesulfobacteriota bacterium]
MPYEVKDTILSEARKCFHLYGFKKTTVDDIAVRTGVSKKTLYKHFSSKDDVIKAVIEQIMEPMALQVDSIIENKTPLSDALKAIFTTVQKVSASISTPMLDDMRMQPEAWQLVKNRRREVLERFAIILTMAKNNGVVRENLDINLYIKILINAIDTFANPTTFLEIDISSEEFAKQILAIFMNGILNNGGRT